MNNPYVFTRKNFIVNNRKTNDKFNKQLDKFLCEHDKIIKNYGFKNSISLKYLEKKLDEYNNLYPNFSDEPIELDINLPFLELADDILKEKNILTIILLLPKEKIFEFIFYKTCLELEWFANKK